MNENLDLRPFRERVLELIEIVSPGSGLKPASEVLNRLRGRIGSWVDERLRLYERASAEVEELRADRVKLQGEIERLTHELAEAHARPSPPDFVQRVDDGAATTVADVIAQVEEPVAESEPLKPQRGDRVRLEGARSLGNTKLQDRWYDVTGATEQDFQVEAGIGRFWIVNDDPGLKEVRRGAAKLPE